MLTLVVLLEWCLLECANLSDANLSGANLSGAYLSGANLSEVEIARISILPDEGDVIGWKRLRDQSGKVIAKLLIKSGTPRSNSTSRKSRAERAEVLEIIGADKGYSLSDASFLYEVGKTVVANNWCEDRWSSAEVEFTSS